MSVDAALARVLDGVLKTVAISELRPYDRNPRRGDIDAIKASLRRHGQYKPLVGRRTTDNRIEILAGNQTFRGMREEGYQEVPVYLIDVDDDLAKRIVVADNRTSDLGGYDSEELATLLAELGDLAGTGYEPGDLGRLLDEISAGHPLDDDEVPPAPAEPVTVAGELIEMGEHRLVCGDARSPGSYERLLGGEAAGVLWTDPPFGVEYIGKTRSSLRITADNADGLEGLLRVAFAAADAVLAPGAPIYLAHPAGPNSLVFLQAFVEAGWSFRQTVIWAKDAFVLGRSDYHYRHEPIVYGYKRGPGRLGRGGQGWFGGNKQSSLLEVPRPRSSRDHPTMKPPELVAACLRNSSRRGGIVLDPFAGSGSTLVACEQLGRKARLVEIDPCYCDVVVSRWERLTGSRAVRRGVS